MEATKIDCELKKQAGFPSDTDGFGRPVGAISTILDLWRPKSSRQWLRLFDSRKIPVRLESRLTLTYQCYFNEFVWKSIVAARSKTIVVKTVRNWIQKHSRWRCVNTRESWQVSLWIGCFLFPRFGSCLMQFSTVIYAPWSTRAREWTPKLQVEALIKHLYFSKFLHLIDSRTCKRCWRKTQDEEFILAPLPRQENGFSFWTALVSWEGRLRTERRAKKIAMLVDFVGGKGKHLAYKIRVMDFPLNHFHFWPESRMLILLLERETF